MAKPVAITLVAWTCFAATVAGQPAAQLIPPAGAGNPFRPTGLSRDLGAPEPLPDPLFTAPPGLFADPAPAPDRTAAPAPGIEFFPRGDLTYLPRTGERGFGVFDVEALGEIRIPFDAALPSLKVSPGFATRSWNGPAAGPDLPGTVYDFYADFGWRPRPFEWLFIDLKATPGFYTDLDNTSHGAFRPRGQALAIVALSEKFQFVGGVVYTNRVRTTMVPAGGFRYAPSEDTEFRIVFPAPKISHRVGDWGDFKMRVYLSGEFGGGAWGVRRADGRDDVVDYSDLRAIAGVEAASPTGRTWHAELGYVFGRRIDFESGVPSTFRPGATLLFRVGTSY